MGGRKGRETSQKREEREVLCGWDDDGIPRLLLSLLHLRYHAIGHKRGGRRKENQCEGGKERKRRGK